MATTTGNRPADPLAKGTLATAKQAFRDLFIWDQRVVVRNDYGEEHCEWQKPEPLKNPFTLMAQLRLKDWLYFACGFLAWTADAYDFHALSIQTTKLASYYKRSNTSITTAITLTLLLRSVGAAFFGLLGDKFGRKWPMVVNMIILGLLQIATIYSATFNQFLAVRSLFGLFMGGVYGNAISMALENCPANARGLMSGILQQGYSFGYVLAACTNLGVGDAVKTWKIVFWVGAGFSITVGLARIAFPESKQFIEAKKLGHTNKASGAFWAETKVMLKAQWRMCLYCIFLMTWFNYYSHTSQDSYTTFMKQQKHLSGPGSVRASILMKTGACVGGTILGYTSQWFGRRRTIVCAALMSACLIPAWILPTTERGLSASGFMIQFFVQGAWGVIPVHLSELSPPEFRSSFVGITYQLGNMISSPSAQIVNAIAESHKINTTKGKSPAYGPVMGIATAIIALGIAITTALGPEKKGRHFEDAGPVGSHLPPAKDIENGSIVDEKDGVRAVEIADADNEKRMKA